MGTHSGFDLEIVLRGFKNCMERDDSVSVHYYLEAFTELTRFFRLLGPIFGFVSSDLEEKLHTLEKHRKSPQSIHYETVQSVIAFEVEKDIARNTKKEVRSGSRCLLRLNRALEFVIEFMQRISQSHAEDKISHIASEVYNDTLAKHHVWIVRKMAVVAVYTLPHRKVLIETICKHSEEESLELVGHVVEAARPVYEHIQQILEHNNLMDIP